MNEHAIQAEIARLSNAIAQHKAHVAATGEAPVYPTTWNPGRGNSRGRGASRGRGVRGWGGRGGRGGAFVHRNATWHAPALARTSSATTPSSASSSTTPVATTPFATTSRPPVPVGGFRNKVLVLNKDQSPAATSTSTTTINTESTSTTSPPSTTTSTTLSSTAPSASTSRHAPMKEVLIDGVKFITDARAHKLIRKTSATTGKFAAPHSPSLLSQNLTLSLPPAPTMASTSSSSDPTKALTPRRASVSGTTYIRTKNGNLISLDVARKRKELSDKKHFEAKKARLDRLVGIVHDVQNARNSARSTRTSGSKRGGRGGAKSTSTRPKSMKLCRFFQKTGENPLKPTRRRSWLALHRIRPPSTQELAAILTFSDLSCSAPLSITSFINLVRPLRSSLPLALFKNPPGQCTNGLRCRYIHDSHRVSICPNFLRSKCAFDSSTCTLSHEPNAHRSPHCIHHPHCTRRPNCPFSHIDGLPALSESTICRPFVEYGWCELGEKCRSRHANECPRFSETGVCEEKGCRLPHVLRRRNEVKSGGGGGGGGGGGEGDKKEGGEELGIDWNAGPEWTVGEKRKVDEGEGGGEGVGEGRAEKRRKAGLTFEGNELAQNQDYVRLEVELDDSTDDHDEDDEDEDDDEEDDDEDVSSGDEEHPHEEEAIELDDAQEEEDEEEEADEVKKDLLGGTKDGNDDSYASDMMSWISHGVDAGFDHGYEF
ncbi:BZ3500_MvSof-1268-A1-R1_Chr3-1g05446 [Microbotryum saponariae]|uniref:BZ3500_MvSof-1268-A1-R1_Chr3-1g05446 protein n=1 Tax=Microbotryum saponariae TaxID=289078 RepID=A0A2X0KWP9_9BASI|nr:BZ3500_MvSof-1268-A1-R1_Chr3-1g05446 [Microbotryum saponariae]SDA04637.1 BZ3501_MvSof-1269-A2-R1_Chr3-1g05117 [Microbotryum saponariae]